MVMALLLSADMRPVMPVIDPSTPRRCPCVAPSLSALLGRRGPTPTPHPKAPGKGSRRGVDALLACGAGFDVLTGRGSGPNGGCYEIVQGNQSPNGPNTLTVENTRACACVGTGVRGVRVLGFASMEQIYQQIQGFRGAQKPNAKPNGDLTVLGEFNIGGLCDE